MVPTDTACDCGQSTPDTEPNCSRCGGVVLPRPHPDAAGADEAAGRPPRRAARGRVVVATLLAIALVALAGVTLRPRRAPQAAAPAATTVAPPVGRPLAGSALEPEVTRLADHVQSVRQLRFRRPVDVRLVDAAPQARRATAGADGGLHQREASEALLRAMGLLEGTVDLDEAGQTLSPAESTAAYDPRTGVLSLPDRPLSDFDRRVLVSELVRALDDQHFHIDRRFADDERAAAFAALVVGDALRVGDDYVAGLAPADRAAVQTEDLRRVGAAVAVIPRPLLAILGGSRDAGIPFVRSLVQQGGEARVDAAFRTPPVSWEQLMHVDRYLRGEGPRRVPAAKPDPESARVLSHGSLGEYGLGVVLAELGDPGRAPAVADGWGGDSYVTWRNDIRSCVKINVVMDTPADEQELVGPLSGWQSRQLSADVTGGDGVTTITACR